MQLFRCSYISICHLKNYEGKGWPKQKEQLASLIESMDHSLGELLAAWERLGTADNTGEPIPYPDEVAPQLPLHAPEAQKARREACGLLDENV